MKVVRKQRALSKLEKAKNNTIIQGKKELLRFAKLGQNHARMISPNRTGALRSFIHTYTTNKGFTAVITSQNTIGLGFYNDLGRSDAFSLPQYFARGGRSSSGDGKYMLSTLKLLKQKMKNIKIDLR